MINADLLFHQLLEWSSGISQEIWFWSRWFETKGLEWKYDFIARQDCATPIEPHLSDLIRASGLSFVKILDVGAGPITNIGYSHPTARVEISACDPLAPIYDRLTQQYSINRPVVTELATAEDLSAFFDRESFDIVNCCNALDHSFDPLRGIIEMLRVVKVGGIILLRHHRNEAEIENYSGFHRTNFDIQEGRFVIWNKERIIDVLNDVPLQIEIDATFESPDVIVKIRKKADFPLVLDNEQYRKRLAEITGAFIRLILAEHK